MSTKPAVIGITANWQHANSDRDLYNGRTLLYLEQSMGQWLLADGRGLPVMLAGVSPEQDTEHRAKDFADAIDGLIISGGADVSPTSYGQQPMDSQWAGDPVRDRYEFDLLKACLQRDRPILGICRGHQVLNVAFGGTLYQDIGTEVDRALNHRDQAAYHGNTHQVVFEEGAVLQSLYGVDGGIVNSVHHQAIRQLGDGLAVEARSPEDGIIESVRLRSENYAVGVQWHPEFQEPHQDELLATRVLLDDFFAAIERRR